MKILITGGAGFVGSNLAVLIKQKYPAYTIICFDNLSRRGSELNLPRLKACSVEFVRGDVRNRKDLVALPPFDLLIDAAAEPSVLAGITSPVGELVDNNLVGTLNCLEIAKNNSAAFIFLSTSRIYPIKKLEALSFIESETRFELSETQVVPGVSAKGISEAFPLEGERSFYGATKLAAELFITEYHNLSGLKTVINRCGVIAGPWQMGKVDQGFTALWVARHFWRQPLRYVGFGGEGKQVRDVLHIRDLFRLIDFQIHNFGAVNGEVFNVGGGRDSSTSLFELTAICEKVSGNHIPITKEPETRVADVRIYITDNKKVSAKTGWAPRLLIEDTVMDIYTWIRDNKGQLEPILRDS